MNSKLENKINSWPGLKAKRNFFSKNMMQKITLSKTALGAILGNALYGITKAKETMHVESSDVFAEIASVCVKSKFQGWKIKEIGSVIYSLSKNEILANDVID